MKICFIADVKSIHSRRWIKPLITNEHEIYVINYRRGASAIPGITEYIDLSSWYQPPKIRFLVWGVWVRGYLRNIQPQIVHAHQLLGAGWIGALAGYHPYVLSGWGSDLLVEPSKSAFRRFLLRSVLSRTDHLTVPSKIMLDAAKALGFPADQVHFIPWGVDPSVFKPIQANKSVLRKKFGLDPNSPVLLSPRRIHPICNIDILIGALPEVLYFHPNTQLALIQYNPDPSYLESLKGLIKELDLQKHVVWLPTQRNEEDIANLYRMTDVVISIPASEGYGASVYEAIATGVPTVISDVPVFDQELIHEVHTLKVPVNDIKKTSAAIIRILNDNKLRADMVKTGLNSSQERSTDVRIDRVEALYNFIIQEG